MTHPDKRPAHITHVSYSDKPRFTLIAGGADAALEADYVRCRRQIDVAMAVDESWRRLRAALAERAGTPTPQLLTIDQAADWPGC